MTAARPEHWDSVYGSKAEDAVSWFQESPEPSFGLVTGLPLRSPVGVVDVGGGASRLVDQLLARGGYEVTVLDVAAEGLAVARRRLADRADEVSWVVSDVTRWQPSRSFDVWHDRAVFHFLTDAADRRHYADVLGSAVRPGGYAVVATFAPDGPEQCSGLPVQRYGPEDLSRALAPNWVTVSAAHHVHVTPWGSEQAFTWLVLQRPPAAP